MNIKKRREELGLTQKQLADMCHMSTQFMSDIENGRYKPSLDTAIKIAQALNVSNINFFSELTTDKSE